MPRYDYRCRECNHRFELKQSFGSEPYATCPKCQNTARRVIHSVPIVFKGSGWYVNDYGKRGSSAGSTSDSKESSDSGTKSETKAEGKPGSKAKAPSKTESSGTKVKGD